MLQMFLAIVLTGASVPECTTPQLSYIYNAREVSAEGYIKTCLVCSQSVTIETEAWGTAHKTTRAISLPDLSAALDAILKAPTDEICDGPMDVAGTEYWLHGEPPLLFSAAGSACWIQSAAPEAAAVESLIDQLCGGVDLTGRAGASL